MEDDNSNDSLSEVSSHISDVAGLVVRLVLKNFMCHEHLRVDFNKHINFICGKNGSGKSAILTGIVIGLGGKTSDTNRGNNLKSLIKSGRSQAIIEVTLTNVGPKAFKPEIYGDEITIIRVINENCGLYRISRRHGKPVSCKRAELTNLLSVFKIQINNPVSILNQDMAKSFIKSSDPKDLYKFFITGTLMNEVEEAISHSKNNTLPHLLRILKEKEEELDYVNKDLEAIKKKHENKSKLIQLESEFVQLEVEFNWAHVHSTRAEICKLEKNSTEQQKNIAELEKKILDKDGSKKELLGELEKTKDKLKELSSKKEESMKEAMDAERTYSNLMNQFKSIYRQKKNLNKELQTRTAALDQVNNRLQVLDNQNTEASRKRMECEAKKEAIQTKIGELKTIINTNNNHTRNLAVSLMKKSEEVKTFSDAYHQLISTIGKAKYRLKELKSNSSELTCFGEYMPRLVEEIERSNTRGKFNRKPVGPLGHHIKLNNQASYKDGSFGPVIENIIGRGLLCGFAVDSTKDCDALKEIFQRLNIQQPPQMVISKFSDRVYDVENYKVKHSRFPSIFDVLDISNHIVANTIIDQVQVENILLLPSDEDAYNLMELVHKVPVNCSRAVTPNALYYPAPSYRSYHLNCKKNTSMLQVNKDSLIRDLEDNLKQYCEDETLKRSSLEKVKEEKIDIETSLNKAQRDTKRINNEIVASEKELVQLSYEEDNASTEQEALKEDIIYRKNAINDIKNQIETISGDVESMKKKCDEAEKVKENVSCSHFDEKINSIQDHLNELEVSYQEFTANFDKIYSRKKDFETMLTRLQSSIAKLQNKLEALEGNATKSGLQIDQQSCRTTDELKERISEVKSEINVIKEFIGNDLIEEITVDLQNQIQKVESISNIIKETQEGSKGMEISINQMVAEFETLRRDKSRKIKSNFKNITHLRNYKEELIFDHSARKLSILIRTDVKNQNTTSVLSLSGGERSYSMVAFILSLWQEMALPFYFLDEFDVFMDPVNRNLIIKLLMMHARINQTQQFVFFTPNDFQIDCSSDISIYRMMDPRDDSSSQF